MAHIQEISAAESPSLSLAPSLRLEEPQQQTKTQVAGHRRKRSIGDDAERTRQAQRMLKELENTVDGFIEKSSDVDYDEIEEIRETIGKISKKLKAIEKYRAKHPGRVIKSISLSAVEETDLIALGLESTPEVVVTDKFQEMIDGLFTSPSSAALNSLLKPQEDFARGLTNINRCIDLRNEAGARIIINHFLLALIDICKPVGLIISIRAEFRLTKKGDPVRIEHKEFTTFLSGIADYGITSIPAELETKYKLLTQAKVQTVETSRKATTMRKQIWILEAKAGDGALKKWLPQAIAQSIALGLQPLYEQAVSSSLQAAAFCLTDGQEWIFGIVIRSSNGTVSCRRTDPLKTGGNQNSAQILQALFFWATTPSHVIWQDMCKLSCEVDPKGSKASEPRNQS